MAKKIRIIDRFTSYFGSKDLVLGKFISQRISGMGEVIQKLFSFGVATYRMDDRRYIDSELSEFYESVYSSEINRDSLAADRENMYQDANNLKADFKKAVKSYHSQKP